MKSWQVPREKEFDFTPCSIFLCLLIQVKDASRSSETTRTILTSVALFIYLFILMMMIVIIYLFYFFAAVSVTSLAVRSPVYSLLQQAHVYLTGLRVIY